MFGLFGGKGKIEIQLDNFNYKPGDTIEGTVSLKMGKAVKAKKLCIILLGESIPMTRGKGQKKQTIFEFEQPLDGEKEYTPSEEPMVYPFKITIPSDILNSAKLPSPAGTAGDVLKAAMFIAGAGRRISWNMVAKLDIPMGADVSKTVQINIT